MDITSRPSLNKDAIRLLRIAEQHCYSENFSGLIIEITTVFLHMKGSPQTPINSSQIDVLPVEPAFEVLPEVNLDGLKNIEFYE